MKAKISEYTKEEMEDAYERGGNTIKGLAREAGCGWKTAKKYWLKRDELPSEPTSSQQTLGPEELEEPEDIEDTSDFLDPKVEEIVNDQREKKQSFESNLESVVREMVDKIDTAKRQRDSLNEQIEQWETYLKNMKL